MEIYYNNDVSITKLVKHNKEKRCEIKKFHKEKTTFFGFTIKEEYDYYSIFKNGYQYKTIEECFQSEYGGKNFCLEGNVIYTKPYVSIFLSNNDRYEKTFDNDIDLDMYIGSLQVKLNKLV